jgi:purine-binding chemotaxis protein CheW
VSRLYVRVRAANQSYALPVEHVLEVAELGEVTPLPGAGAAVVGVRNLRGQVVTVVDLAAVLGLPSETMTTARIVIAEQGGRTAGLAVDEVQGVEQLPETTEEVDSRHLVRMAVDDGSLVGVLDVDSILAAAERTPAFQEGELR